MGYYDGHYRSRKKKSYSWMYPFIFGILAGAFLFAFLLPTLVKNDWLPYEVIVGSKEPQAIDQYDGKSSGANHEFPTTNMNVDITTRVTEIVSRVSPAVVGVITISDGRTFLFQEESPVEGSGSGVIYKIDGDKAYIVTNHHVIQGADALEIVLSNDRRVEAKLLGSDLYTDLAVIEMDSEYVDFAIGIGKSDNVHVGEPVIAIGNPLGMYLSGSVTQGIVSGKQRAIPQDFNGDGIADWQAEVIQTDAAINPGNSGGALINMDGKLIGINSMKIAESAVEGIGFSIPVDDAVPIIEELEATGKVTRPFLGIEAYSLDDIPTSEWRSKLNVPHAVDGGIYIRSVERLSPADIGGLEAYDVITHLDGEPIYNIIDLRKHLYTEKQVEDTLHITYYRDGEKRETTVELTSLQY